MPAFPMQQGPAKQRKIEADVNYNKKKWEANNSRQWLRQTPTKEETCRSSASHLPLDAQQQARQGKASAASPPHPKPTPPACVCQRIVHLSLIAVIAAHPLVAVTSQPETRPAPNQPTSPDLSHLQPHYPRWTQRWLTRLAVTRLPNNQPTISLARPPSYRSVSRKSYSPTRL